jgi:hypothetical protein
MQEVLKVLDRLIEYLELRISSLDIDDYNESTRTWSQGYKKGAEWVLSLVKYFRNTLEG